MGLSKSYLFTFSASLDHSFIHPSIYSIIFTDASPSVKHKVCINEQIDRAPQSEGDKNATNKLMTIEAQIAMCSGRYK